MSFSFPEGTQLQGMNLTLLQRLGDDSDVGEVYRARFRDTILRAVKIIDPRREGVDTLDIEVGLMSVVRHTNIIRITDFTYTGASHPSRGGAGQQVFAIAMDYVDGVPFYESIDRNEREFIVRLDQLLDAIAYLHTHGILHMDIKSENVIVERESGSVVLIDLGYSVVADVNLFEQTFGSEGRTALGRLAERSDVFVRFTKEWAAPEFVEFLELKVNRERLKSELFPRHDLHTLGRLLSQALDHPDSKYWRHARPGLSQVRDWLLDSSSPYYTDTSPSEAARRVHRDIQKLYPEYLSPLGIQEFAIDVEKSTQIILSLGSVHVPPRSRRIVGHPFFQRLRALPQLELLTLVYPDAKQTRFSHSLATFNYCRQALGFLLVQPEFRMRVEREDVQATLLFALLHDIGHYPLSHMFEDVRGLGTELGDPVLEDDEIFEDMFVGGSQETPIGRAVAAWHEGESLAALVAEEYGSKTAAALRSIGACACHKQRPQKPIHRVLAGLISSAGDVDKIAYLVGDSHFTGVPYGRGIDVWGYFRTLRVPELFLKEEPNGHPVIAIDERGLKAIESIINARYSMLERVYWHERNRAVMAMYKQALFKVFGDGERSGGMRFSRYFMETFWFTDAEASQYLSNVLPGSGIDGLDKGKRAIAWELLSVARQDEPELWEALTTDVGRPSGDSDVLISPGKRAAELAELVEKAVCDATKVCLESGAVMIDVPWKGRDQIHPEEIIVVSRKSSRAERPPYQTLSQASDVVAKLGDEFLNGAKQCRVFVRPDDFDHLRSAGKVEQARLEALHVLSEALGLKRGSTSTTPT